MSQLLPDMSKHALMCGQLLPVESDISNITCPRISCYRENKSRVSLMNTMNNELLYNILVQMHIVLILFQFVRAWLSVMTGQKKHKKYIHI